ncbi:MAG: penicillin-binding protein 2 [Candidatus Andersenbacteria bacterium]|nr:penicillin-binding protein 2 [Candidatus Andersenbacteria bacterium]
MLYTPRRIWFIALAILLCLGGLLARLINLQIFRASYYEAVADNQRQRAAELAPHRGTIYLQEHGSGELFPVAVNDKAHIAYAIPRDMDDPLFVARELAPGLLSFRQRQQARTADTLVATGQVATPTPTPDAPPADAQLAALTEELYRKFDKKADPYEPFLRLYETLDEPFLQFFNERPLPGIVIEEVEVRTYPEKTLASHVLGYVGWDEDRRVGRYGIEGFFHQQLAGTLGFFSAERDSRGSLIGVARRELLPAQDGADIVLTIDRVVQSIIEEELADGVKRFNATRGSILVMDPFTGAVLGLATYPTFDPNHYYAIQDPRVQLNPVTSEIFEPGSILKPIIMTTALSEGAVRPDSTMQDSGPVRVADYTINTYDGQHHGRQTMTQVLEQSNNIGMVWVGQQLGAEVMYDYLRRFGLGEKTGIELEGETASSLRKPDQWNSTTVATVAFGQGVALTPLQALNGINVLANGGELVQPHIISRLKFSNGTQQTTQPQTVRRVISESIAEQGTAMLVSVIERGVARAARVPGYYLAGKTGTAQVPDAKGQYDPDRKIISFVGYGPAQKPRFSILIKLDDPAGLSFAAGTAAPMFRRVAEKLITYYQIPPDYNPDHLPPPPPPAESDNRGA